MGEGVGGGVGGGVGDVVGGGVGAVVGGGMGDGVGEDMGGGVGNGVGGGVKLKLDSSWRTLSQNEESCAINFVSLGPSTADPIRLASHQAAITRMARAATTAEVRIMSKNV